MATCDSASTTQPVVPPPSNWWKRSPRATRPACSIVARQKRRSAAPSVRYRASPPQRYRFATMCNPSKLACPLWSPALHLAHHRVDQPPRDADRIRELRQLVDVKPLRGFDFKRIDADFATFPVGDEGD